MGQDPKAKSKSTKAKAGWGDWQGYFINVDLSAADKEHVKKWDYDHVRVHEWLTGKIEDGFKFSLSQQEDGTSYLASLTDRRKESGSYQGTLTGRGKTVEFAIISLYYKDASLLQGTWPTRGGFDDDIG